jgi:hypothetical protein
VTQTLNPYPEEMRNQLWPLCCGAAIVSGFKGAPTGEALDAALAAIPYNQVYSGETRKPQLVFICLNHDQAKSPSISKLLSDRGFVLFMQASNTTYGVDSLPMSFYVRHPKQVTFTVEPGVHTWVQPSELKGKSAS